MAAFYMCGMRAWEDSREHCLAANPLPEPWASCDKPKPCNASDYTFGWIACSAFVGFVFFYLKICRSATTTLLLLLARSLSLACARSISLCVYASSLFFSTGKGRVKNAACLHYQKKCVIYRRKHCYSTLIFILNLISFPFLLLFLLKESGMISSCPLSVQMAVAPNQHQRTKCLLLPPHGRSMIFVRRILRSILLFSFPLFLFFSLSSSSSSFSLFLYCTHLIRAYRNALYLPIT